MLIIHNQYPFDHFIIKDIFESNQYQEVVDELIFLKPRLAKQDDRPMRHCIALFLDRIYTEVTFSSIYFHTRKIFRDKLIKERIMGVKGGHFSKWEPESLRDSTLVEYYDDGDYYTPCIDNSMFSSITSLYQNPKAFDGGKFRFPEFDYSVEIEDNTTILFPSKIVHEMTPISIGKSGQLLGPFLIKNFISPRE